MNYVALSEVAKIIMGQSPPSSTYNSEGNGLPFFQGKADFGDIYPRARVYCSKPNKIAESGDILITVRAPVGPTNLNRERSCIGRGLAALRVGINLDRNYLFYFLRYYEPQLAKAGTGSTFTAISREDLENIKFPLPPLPEQQRIAAILQKADRLRRLRRYARQLSDGYLQSVFLEMFGDPKSNPNKWEMVESNKIISNIRYGTGSPPAYVEKGIPFLRATNVKNGTIETDGLVFISEDEARKISKCKLNKGDLLLVRSGVNSGDCALIPSSYQGAYAAYDLIIEMAYPYNYYFNFLINSDYGKNIISTLSRRAGQPHINSDQVKSVRLPLPPKALIGEFAKLIQENEKLKTQQIESVRQTEMLFQSLLQRAFQGELKDG